jgi:hypothetical protein
LGAFFPLHPEQGADTIELLEYPEFISKYAGPISVIFISFSTSTSSSCDLITTGSTFFSNHLLKNQLGLIDPKPATTGSIVSAPAQAAKIGSFWRSGMDG